MPRNVLGTEFINLEALKKIETFHVDIVKEVQEAVRSNKVVIVGMAQNPVVKKARKELDEAGIVYKYLEYGSYFRGWKIRLAIKLWSGWPTYPQIFFDGKLVGGRDEAIKALAEGKMKN